VRAENDASHVALLAPKVAAAAKSWYTDGKAVCSGYNRPHTSPTHRCSSGLNSLEMNALATASSLDMSVESASRPSSCARGFIFSGSKNHSLSGQAHNCRKYSGVVFTEARLQFAYALYEHGGTTTIWGHGTPVPPLTTGLIQSPFK